MLTKIFRIGSAIRTRRNLRQFKRCAVIGRKFSCGNSSRCFNENCYSGSIIIGDCVEILGSLVVQHTGKITIGDRTTIRFGTTLESVHSIEIGSDVIISNNVVISDNNSHPVCPLKRLDLTANGFYGERWKWKHSAHEKVVIEDNVWIGRHATVLKGVRIGIGAVVAACAVVVRDVPPYSIVAGNPGRIVKTLELQ